MSPRVEALPEVYIQVDPVKRKGDTLSFDMHSYTEQSDQNIEDVLKRLPGISVGDNGRISYRGFPISKFYIEGLDLLEGRYKIATRNLNMDAVRDIEIIEHHQSKKVLQDLIRPEEAAINLKLKSDIAFTGSAELGGGIGPPLRQVGGDVWGFGKGYQFNILGSINNVNTGQVDNYQDLYTSLTDLDLDLVSVNRVLSPINLKNKEFSVNDEYIGGINILKKTSPHSELKWNFNYSNNDYESQGKNITSFKSNQDMSQQIFDMLTTDNVLNTNNNLLYEINKDNIFLRANTHLSINKTTSSGEHFFNQHSNPEDLLKYMTKFKGNFEATFRHGDKAFTVFADMSYSSNNDSLTVLSTNILPPLSTIPIDSDFLQHVGKEVYRLDSYTRFFNKKGNFSSTSVIGLEYENEQLVSGLEDLLSTSPIGLMENTFINDISLKEVSPYVYQTFKIDKKNNKWKFSVPLKWYNYRIDDEVRTLLKKESLVLFDANLEYQRLTKGGTGFTASYLYSRNIDKYNVSYYNGYILSSNRNISRSGTDIRIFSKNELSLTIDKNDYLRGLYYRVKGSYAQSTYNLINDESFFSLGSASNLILENNSRDNIGFEGLITAQISRSLSFKKNLKLFHQRMPLISNGQRIRISQSSVLSNLELSYIFGSSIVSFKPSWYRQNNDLIEDVTDNISFRLVYFIKKNSLGSLKLNIDRYLIRSNDIIQWNNLVGLTYSRSFKKQRLDLLITLNNITNESEFITLNQRINYSRFTSIQLRPLRIQLIIKKKF